jgi:hypothetical protein
MSISDKKSKFEKDHPYYRLWNIKDNHETEWNYLALNEYIKQIKGSPEKIDDISELLNHRSFFNFEIKVLFDQIQDDKKVYEVLKNVSSITEKVSLRLGLVKMKDIPLIRKNPHIVRLNTWISNIYANEIIPIEDYYSNYYWARELFCEDIIFPYDENIPSENRLFTILKEWRKNPPDMRIKKELKMMLNMVDRFEDYGSGKKLRQRTSIVMSTLHVIQENSEMIPTEFVHLLIHFGAEFNKLDEWILHVSRTSLIKARKWMEIYSEFEKIFFGMKINKWGTKWMDDSFDFSPMRARIDLTDTLKTLEAKEKWVQEKETNN